MRPPITYYGGKQKLVKELLPLIPPHELYVEAFMGGGALFFAKEPSKAEIINDLNGNVSNFYRVVKTDFEELKKLINGTLHSRATYQDAKKIYNCKEKIKPSLTVRAWAFWVLTNDGFSGKIGSWAMERKSNKTGKTLANKRENFCKEYAKRLENISIESKDALLIIKQYDSPDTFFYLDPPYFNSDCGHYKGYTEADYVRLLDALVLIKGKFVLSSYPSDVLTRFIEKNGWQHKEIKQKTSVSTLSKKIKTEVLVWNYSIDTTPTQNEKIALVEKRKPIIKTVAKINEIKKDKNSIEDLNSDLGVRFSSEKSKQKSIKNLAVEKYSAEDCLPHPKSVRSFEDTKENPEQNGWLSIEKCKKILEQSGGTYSDEQVFKIRKLLYKMGNLDYQLFTQFKTKSHEKCHPVRESIHRRTSSKRNKHSFPKRAA